MRKIAVVTVGRSDYGLLRPILQRLAAEREVELQLLVSGAHLSKKFGWTLSEIEADGLAITAKLPLPETADAPESVAVASGAAIAAFGTALAVAQPDLLLLLGDRFEMHAAAVAALPLRLPVAHIHGGELTLGAIDDALRHSLTKLSHLHFPATEEYAARICQMGEEAWRVTVSGAPGLDNLRAFPLATAEELIARHRLPFIQPPLLVTFHPETLSATAPAQLAELLAALAARPEPLLFTSPNADPGHEAMLRELRDFCARRAGAILVAHLGTQDYFSAMAWAVAMVGNSSSGIIEAASFGLPVVNIGGRQEGRTRAANVLDCPPERAAIRTALARAVDPTFRSGLAGLGNPYGDGQAAERIVSRLLSVPLDDKLLRKRFSDLPRC